MRARSKATRALRSGDKKPRILAAAIKVFADKGFFNARINEIAREAGVADGTIYLYFDSKDDLLIQVFEASMDRIIARLTEVLAELDDPVDKIRGFIEHHLNMVAEDPALAEVITVELRQSSKFMKEYRNPKFTEYLRMIDAILEEGRDAGVLRPDLDCWLTARALFGMLDELALTWVLGKRFDLGECATLVHEMFFNGMRANAPQGRPSAAK